MATSTQKHLGVPLGRRRTGHWLVCNRCGLLLLRNKASEQAWRAPCGARPMGGACDEQQQH